VDRLRRRLPSAGVLAPEVQVGKGALLQTAMKRFDEIASTVAEMRPKIIPVLAEYKPGTIVKKFLPEAEETKTYGAAVTSPTGKAVVEGEVARKKHRGRISVEI